MSRAPACTHLQNECPSTQTDQTLTADPTASTAPCCRRITPSQSNVAEHARASACLLSAPVFTSQIVPVRYRIAVDSLSFDLAAAARSSAFFPPPKGANDAKAEDEDEASDSAIEEGDRDQA